MSELFRESIALYNLPLTGALVLVLVYWAMVIVGTLDLDFLSDLHVDPGSPELGGGGMDLDAGAGGGMEVHGQVGEMGHDVGVGDGGHDAHHQGGAGGGGALTGALNFINASDVPLMMVISFLTVFMWVIGVTANFYFNPGTVGDRSAWLALLLLVPNFILSALLTKIATTPLKGVMRKLNDSEKALVKTVGREGKVLSSEVTREFGRVEVETKGSPIVLNARISEGSARLIKGDPVLIFDHDEEEDTYLVRKSKPSTLEE